jgi:RHS repeat-associated protein
MKMYKLPTQFFATILLVLLMFQPLFALRVNNNVSAKTAEKNKRIKTKNDNGFFRQKKNKQSPLNTKVAVDSNVSVSGKVKPRIKQSKALLEGQSVTRLPDGRWLLLGGLNDNEISNLAVISDEDNKSAITLQSRMKFARAGHSATLLPNGNVLILGGKVQTGEIVAVAEVFNPQTEEFTEIKIPKLLTRTNHTATLLTNGRILISGGVDRESRIVRQAELIDSGNFVKQNVTSQMQESRYGQTAELQSDDTVLLQKGFDENGVEVSFDESFNPETESFSITGSNTEFSANESSKVVFSQPDNGDTSVPVDIRPAIRFTKLLKVKTANAQTVVLTSTGGAVEARVVPAENGRLVFITPLTKLKPDTTYNIKLSGILDQNNLPLSEMVIVFKTEEFCEVPNPTASNSPHHSANNEKQIIDGDTWIPGDDRFKKDKNPKMQESPALQAPAKVTGLSGIVLSLSGKPLAGATLTVQGKEAVTDGQGRFLLTGLKAVQSGMTIHGETVNSPGKTYGTFEVLVDIDEGKTNKLPYNIYLPVIDKLNEKQIGTPTQKETIITSPRIPGMEVRIAANSVLKMPKGHGMSHNLTDLTSNHQMLKLGITPIPIERPPFPLPSGVEDGLLFTLQMHGAKVQGPKGEKRPGLRFIFPNTVGQQPGARVSFWNYDSTAAGWTWYGYGTVNKDGSKIIPDPGVELEGMQCLSLMTSMYNAPDGPVPGSHGYDGDPVDLQTGLFVHEQTDLILPDTMPLKITRTYRQNDGQREFGIGFTHAYSMFIAGDTHNFGFLILPDGGRVKFVRDHSNTSEWVAYHTETATAFYKAEMRYLSGSQIDYEGGGWEIKMRDGTRLTFARKTIWGSILGIHASFTVLHQITDRFGNKLTLTRDANLRLNRIVSSNNKWVEFSYIGESSLIGQVRDSIGRTVSYAYDSQNRLTKVTDAEGGETFYTYDAAHRMLTLKDARGIVNLTNEYDFAGRVKKQTSADGTVYQFAYSGPSQYGGKIVQTDVTNPRGLVRRMNFNDNGFPTSETFGVGRSDAWTYTYERDPVSNRVLRITDNWNQKTAFNYDEFGNMLSTTYLETTPNAVTTSATYTNFDNVATTTDSLNRTSNFVYDDKGLLTSAKDWLDRQSTFSYNAKGQVLTATDNLNRTSRFTYDRGTLVESEDPTGRKVRQFVDGGGRATRIYDPMGGVTKYRFNKFNRPLQVTDPQGRTGALLYDAVGNILEITDSKGGKIKYTYDAMNRPLTRADQMNRVETYQYDAYGNLWKATDHKGQITEFTYDVFNRPTLVKYHDNTTTSYSYDAKGRVESTTDSAGGTITYGYDAYDRVNAETTAAGTVNYVYDAGGRITSMQAPNQPTVTYGYDTADRIQGITQNNQTVSFTYDDSDRRLSMSLPNGITAFYTYDSASQLKTLVYMRGTTVLGEVGFEYDGLGRRTHVSGSLAQILSPTPFANASYDASNRQTAVNSQSLTFDQNGNLTSDGTNTYTWNARDELVSMSGPSLTASFQYDGEGRRISKTVNGITTTYTYDGLQVVAEQQQSGPVTTQLAGGLDEVFFRKTTSGGNSQLEYLLTDALGSTWGLADSTGNVNTNYQYDIFGQTQQSGQTSATNNSLQFAGRENDGTGLYYYRNRYYSPSLRCFISRDPLRESAGENEYAYVKNNPISLTDPLGLQEGPVNYLRNPFPPENWIGNGFSNTVNDTVSLLVDLDSVAQSAWTLGNWCKPMSERLWAAAHLGSEIVMTVFGGKIIKGAGGAIFKRLPCNPFTTKWLGKACFVKGTLIHTKEGLVPIEEIKSGDEVLSYNQDTKQTEYKPVIETYIRYTETIVKLEIEGEAKAVETTQEHPFYIRIHKARDSIGDDDGDWRDAGSLKIGDEVLSSVGTWQKIVGVEQKERSEQVYNFAVEDNHNYFVGQNGTLVHNNCADELALGLKNGLNEFANSVGAKTYLQKSKLGAGFDPDEFLDIARQAQKIHFNLNGFNFTDFGRWLKAGNFDPNIWYGTVTNHELFTILTNPSLLSKTKFY